MKEARRRKLYYCLALISTLIAVTVTAVALSITSFTPLIFLKASEAQAGSIDVTISSNTVSFQENDGVNIEAVTRRLLLNTTRIKEQIRPKYHDTMASRYTFQTTMRILGSNPQCPMNAAAPYTLCESFATSLVLQETGAETDIGIGTGLGLPNEIPYGGVIMTGKLASSLGLKQGDKAMFRVGVTSLLQQIVVQFNFGRSPASKRIENSLFSGATAYLPFVITKTLGENMVGKFATDDSNMVITEMKHFLRLLSNNMPSTSARFNANYNDFLNYLKTAPMQDYASKIIFNMEDRMEVYKNPNFDVVQDSLTEFAAKISTDLGIYPFKLDLPLYELLSKLKFVQLFLGLVLNLIIAVLFILGTILIYNILLVTVETKTFEFGVIRMIGVTKVGIAQLIFVQALSFSVPAIILGLSLSVPILIYFGHVLESFLSTSIPVSPSPAGILWSIAIGLLIPIVSSYYPMKEALKKDLNLSLDTAHSKTTAVQISLAFKGKNFPWAYVTFGLLAVVFGVMIHVILPLSLLSLNISLLLGMFFVILLGLIFGLTLLSLNLEHIMERFITTVAFFWTKESYQALIMKNLVAHKIRNRQTAIMYSLSLGFVVFLMVALSQLLNTMSYSVQAAKGALIQVSTAELNGYLDQTTFETLIDNIQVATDNAIESYAWITRDLLAEARPFNVGGVSLTHKGRLYKYPPAVRGVSPTIFKTTINKFLVVDEQDEDTGLDLGEQLYTARGSQGAIIGKTYSDKLGVSMDEDTSITVELESGKNSYSEELRVIAVLESAPAFKFSKLPGEVHQDMLVSLPTFARLVGKFEGGLGGIHMERLLVKVRDDRNDLMDLVVTKMNEYKTSTNAQWNVWTYQGTESSLKNNQSTLTFIFMAVEVLAMVFCFFSLVTSMSTNILEQTKEIAVLRAVGMTKRKVNLLFVCEAFVLVLSSAAFGVLIGTAVAAILFAQQTLFTQLPLPFTFPWGNLAIIFIGAIISAFFSSYLPASRITRHPISKIIRLGA